MQIRVQHGSLPAKAQNLKKLVDSHPFTHRLDVVFAASDGLSGLLKPLQTSYYSTTLTFVTVFSDFASGRATSILSLGLLATEDVWCLDARGILTLSLTQATYQHLGVIGARHMDKFRVSLDLRDTSRLAVQARESLIQWDVRRAAASKTGWDVLLLSSSSLPEIRREVKPLLQTSFDILVPPPALPSLQSETAHEELTALFEWVGLACLGSQRLYIKDSSSSYIASYDPPAGSSVGYITHLSWTGFLSPVFVDSILKQVLGYDSLNLAAITAVTFDGPVSYISSSGATQGGESAWSLVASQQGAEINWILAETSQ